MRGQHHNLEPRGSRCGGTDGLATRERAVAAIAARQHGVITRQQLIRCGISGDTIDRWLRRGRLHRLHRGVYLLGPRILREWTREMAAVLACRAAALLSHRSAAQLWHLLPHAASPAIAVTIAGRDPGRKPGITVHRVAGIERWESRLRVGIPVTSPARTLLDLAAAAPDLAEQATAEAFAKGLVRNRDLLSVLERHPRRPGAKRLRVLTAGTPSLTRSEAERHFLALVRKSGLPAPEVNAKLWAYEVDFLWRRERLVVEVDGFAFHSSRPAFERDRRRDADLVARGFRVLRITWRQIVEGPEALVARLAQALASSLWC